MARLHEYQGKEILRKSGISVPEGQMATSLREVKEIAEQLKNELVLKAQVWTTGRFSKGLIQFADDAEGAVNIAMTLFGKSVDNFVVDKLLVEKKNKH